MGKVICVGNQKRGRGQNNHLREPGDGAGTGWGKSLSDGNPVGLYGCSKCGIGHICTDRWCLYHNRYPELPDGA